MDKRSFNHLKPLAGDFLCLQCKRPMPYFFQKYGKGGVCSKRCDDLYKNGWHVDKEGL